MRKPFRCLAAAAVLAFAGAAAAQDARPGREEPGVRLGVPPQPQRQTAPQASPQGTRPGEPNSDLARTRGAIDQGFAPIDPGATRRTPSR